MKSGKQRKAEIKAARLKRSTAIRAGAPYHPLLVPRGVVVCDPTQLAPGNSYGAHAKNAPSRTSASSVVTFFTGKSRVGLRGHGRAGELEPDPARKRGVCKRTLAVAD